MTYNFDPDRWYEDRRAQLDARLARAEITAEEHLRRLVELDASYERIIVRLDNTYRVLDD